ncbi:MAG: MotA/TolQ/ExbB proton channel family protein [Deltaproteobacteria bacterium]|nr:MotA/TolQ/ExbB proton channel family protein [Deltaproteobacteria bacterium]
MWKLLVSSLFPLTITSSVLWLLLFLSVVSVAVMIERALFFRANQSRVHDVLDEILKDLTKGDLKSAQARIGHSNGIQARVAAKALESAQFGVDAFHEAKAAALLAERRKMEQRLAILGTLGSNAPFLGLFGTVLGIIKAFHDLSINVEGGPSTVMAGISEALMATATGLFVALPAVVAYNVFQRKIRRIAQESDEITRLMAARLAAREEK